MIVSTAYDLLTIAVVSPKYGTNTPNSLMSESMLSGSTQSDLAAMNDRRLELTERKYGRGDPLSGEEDAELRRIVTQHSMDFAKMRHLPDWVSPLAPLLDGSGAPISMRSNIAKILAGDERITREERAAAELGIWPHATALSAVAVPQQAPSTGYGEYNAGH